MLRSCLLCFPLLVAFACSGPVALKAKSKASHPSGTALSEIAGVDQQGRKFSLDAALAEGPVVVIFYRGHW